MPVTDTRAKTVQSLLEKYGLSARWMARKLGASPQSVTTWLDPDGNHPRDPNTYDEMIDVLRRDGPKEAQIALKRTGARLIPVYGAIAAGTPGSSYSDVEFESVLDWGNDFERWGRRVDGYSMSPCLLPDDIAIFESRRPEVGDVVHAFSDGEDCVKAIRGAGESMMLWSFNEDYEPFSAAGWKVKGVCVGRIRYSMFGIRQQTDFPRGLNWAMRHESF